MKRGPCFLPIPVNRTMPNTPRIGESPTLDDSNDSYSDMDRVCNAVSTAMLPHWSSLPEPEISGEAVAFALVATQSRRSGREMTDNAWHALGSNADSAQERQPGGYASVSASRSPAYGHQECAAFQRTHSDPLAKRARDTTHALSVLSSARNAHMAADSGWKRACVECASPASRIDDAETTYSSDLTQFETRPSSAHGWSSFGDDDADSRVLRASSASSATLAPVRHEKDGCATNMDVWRSMFACANLNPVGGSLGWTCRGLQRCQKGKMEAGESLQAGQTRQATRRWVRLQWHITGLIRPSVTSCFHSTSTSRQDRARAVFRRPGFRASKGRRVQKTEAPGDGVGNEERVLDQVRMTGTLAPWLAARRSN